MRRILHGVVIAFALAACVMAYVIHVQQQALFGAERYDAAVYAVKAKTEAATFGVNYPALKGRAF